MGLLTIECERMQAKTYYSTYVAAKECGLNYQVLDYTRSKRRSRITRQKGGHKVFNITWLD